MRHTVRDEESTLFWEAPLWIWNTINESQCDHQKWTIDKYIRHKPVHLHPRSHKFPWFVCVIVCMITLRVILILPRTCNLCSYFLQSICNSLEIDSFQLILARHKSCIIILAITTDGSNNSKESNIKTIRDNMLPLVDLSNGGCCPMLSNLKMSVSQFHHTECPNLNIIIPY